ncbi:alpha/beta fold hydrolase [Pseudomonas sp. GV071]|uniref:alpha/beta fold hydrolase n=1 Tax=Pseudomonas sp. GV071 TaxID=2135754 RepID=UPI00353228A5
MGRGAGQFRSANRRRARPHAARYSHRLPRHWRVRRNGTGDHRIDAMARDVIELSNALGLNTVDLLGFSLGGFVAQDIVLKAPERVRRLILTGTGPAGGTGIEQVGKVSWPLMVKGLFTLRDPKTYLFFTSTANGRLAAKAFLQRLKERKSDRDKGPTPAALLRQLKAIKAWGRQAPQALDSIRIPVLIANGDHDIMVPTENSHDMARRIPGAKLVIYKDAGHGGIFQYHGEFVRTALAFLEAQPESIGTISPLTATETMK